MRGLLACATTAVLVLTGLVTVPSLTAAAVSCNTLGGGGDWPTAGHDLENGTGATLSSTPTEMGGCVYIGSSAGYVYA